MALPVSIYLSGVVFDDQGAPLEGATATLYNFLSQTPVDTTQTFGGVWSFGDLTPQSYKVKVEYNGQVRWYLGSNAVQFSTVFVGGTAALDATAGLYLKQPEAPDNSALPSPAITLVGCYDSDAGAGVTRVDKKMSIKTVVATDGKYHLGVFDDSNTEVFQVQSTGTASGTAKAYHSHTPARTSLSNSSNKVILYEQEVVLAVKSAIQAYGRYSITNAAQSNFHGYLYIDTEVLDHDEFYSTTSNYRNCALYGLRVMDPGTYKVYVKADSASSGGPWTIPTDDHGRSHLDVIVTPVVP